MNEEADVCVVEVGPEFELVGTNRLEELCLASPAVADGKPALAHRIAALLHYPVRSSAVRT